MRAERQFKVTSVVMAKMNMLVLKPMFMDPAGDFVSYNSRVIVLVISNQLGWFQITHPITPWIVLLSLLLPVIKGPFTQAIFFAATWRPEEYCSTRLHANSPMLCELAYIGELTNYGNVGDWNEQIIVNTGQTNLWRFDSAGDSEDSSWRI